MQYPVPQFIEVEDKIIGPLTLRQFLTLIAGGVVCLVAWSLADMELFIFISFIVMAAAIGFAFVKVNGRLLHEYLFSMFQYFSRPQIRTWAKELTMQNIEFRSSEHQKDSEEEELKKRGLNESSLKRLSNILDTYGEKMSPIGEEMEMGEKEKENPESSINKHK